MMLSIIYVMLSYTNSVHQWNSTNQEILQF